MKTILMLALLICTITANAALTPDQIARTLAGFHPMMKTPGVNVDFQGKYRFSVNQLSVIREFARTKLSGAYTNSQTVFYPFGGPDVVFPITFFPNMKTLILAGLEAPGSLPTTLTFPEAERKIGEIRAAYFELFKRGYYITEKMSYELREFGTTTMICVGLAMLDNTVEKVEPGPLPGRSVKITYTTPTNETRQVYYFQGDLSDKSITPAFVNLVQQMRVDTTYYKASSYVPQLNGFSTVNSLALAGRYFVQSDTGLKMSEFAKAGGWKVNLFGQYVSPAPIFTGTKAQPGLFSAYANSICRSGDATALQQFTQIWGVDACSQPASAEGNIATYAGALNFPYDYAGKLSPPQILKFSSNLIYAVRK